MPAQPDSLDQAMALLRTWCQQRYPHLRPARLIIQLEERGKVVETLRLPIPPAPAAPLPPP